MRGALVGTVVAAFALLAVLHLYWAMGGTIGGRAAVPQVGKAPAFSPSPGGTLAVAIALSAAAGTVAAVGGMIRTPAPPWMPTVGSLVLAAVLLVRAIGDFRLVGFFKSNREGRFAELDTLVYSPVCVALGLAIITIVASQEQPA